MAQYIGYDGNQSAMADEERLNDLQDITNSHTVRQSFSLPMMPSNVPPLMPNQCGPYIHIIEEPTNKPVRFRYECEGRSAGSIPGMNSTATKKTHPTIQICNYNGPVVLVVSCVTVDPPYFQHPHNLICKEEGISCKDGVYSKSLKSNELRFELQKVGIQCVKIKGAVKSLENRRLKNCDPFKAGYSHMADTKKINLNQLRLCYQVFHKVGKKMVPSEPVVSSPIYGKSNELTIVEISSCSSKMSGNDKIIMLCDKVAKNDIRIRFFETNENGEEVWSADGIFESQNVYRQMAITFRTPRYRNPETQDCVKVALELVRDSDKARSDPVEFEYYPNPGMLTFARLQRKLKRKQELDVFQQILSIDSETTATKYSCPPVDVNEDENTVSSDEQQSSGTLNDFEIAVKKMVLRQRVESEADATATEYTDGLDNDNDEEADMGIELEVPQLLPQLADDCTQTSTPMEEILQQPQLQSRPLSNVDKINEWMKSSEFERTDSLTVENGDTPTVSHSTAQTAFTNVSSLTANTTITNQLEEEEKLEEDGEQDVNGSRRDTLENAALKELPVGEESLPEPETETQPEPELVSASAQASVDIDENFDETATYTSLQIAYNHPVEMPLNPNQVYHASNPFSQLDEAELVVLTNPPAPKIKVNAAQTPATPPVSPPLPLPPRTPSPDPDHRLPPLPPKPRHSQDLSVSEQSVSNSVSLSRSRNGSVSSARTTPSPIIIMRTPDQSPTKRLPSTSASTSGSASASPKKRQGFFSRLFSRRRSRAEDEETLSVNGKQKDLTPTGSREPSLAHFALGDPNRSSIRSLQPPGLSPNKSGRPVGRSSSSVSGKRPAHLDADVIHIPLKGGDSENSLLRPESYSNASTLSYGRPLDRKTLSTLQLADIPICDGNMELVAIADRQSIKNLCEGAYGVMLDPSVDLSEAEHFALYTSKSPEPERELEGSGGTEADQGDFLSADEIARRLAEANGLQIKFESVKRKLSDNLSQKNKQSRTNQMDTLNVPQNQAPFIHTYQPSAPSPTGSWVPTDIKNEQAIFEQFNYSSVSSSPNYGNLTHSPNYGNLTHSPNHGNLPLSPSSSCSGTGFGSESVILQKMNYQTQQQQLEQQRQEEEQRQQQLLQQLEQQRQEEEQRQQQLLQQLEQQRQEEEQRQQQLLQQLEQQRRQEEQRQQQLLQQQQQQQQQWHCPEKHPTCDPNTELMNSLTMLTINFPQTNGDPQRTIQPTNEDHVNVELTHLATTCNVLSLPTMTSIPTNNTDNNNALSSNQNFTNPPDYIQYDQLEPATTEEILEICNSDFIEQINKLNPE
ncbi:hypothetical protein ACLKA6_014536 [Drosophila palustris]